MGWIRTTRPSEKAGSIAAWNGLSFLSRPYLISLRNTFRRKGRLALTLFDPDHRRGDFHRRFQRPGGLDQYITQIGHYFLADVSINFSEPYRINEVRAQALEIPGVEYLEGWAFVSGEALHPDGSLGENLQVLAPPAGSILVDPLLASGRWLQPGDDHVVTVSEDLLDEFPDLKPGDTLRLKLNGKEEDWKVAGIFKFVGGGVGAGTLAYANYEPISELTGLANRAFSYRIAAGCNEDLACQAEMISRVDPVLPRERLPGRPGAVGRLAPCRPPRKAWVF